MPFFHTELYCAISLLLDHEQYGECITTWTLFLMFIYWVENPRFRIVGQDYVAFLIMKTQTQYQSCLLYTSPSPRDLSTSRMPSSA